MTNILSDILQRYLTIYPQSLFEFMRSITPLRIDAIKILLPQIESIVVDLEKYRRPNAASLRYTLNQFQNFVRNMVNKQ